MSVHAGRRKGPYRDDMVVLTATVMMVLLLYGAVDYPHTMANISNGGGGGGGGGTLPPSVTYLVEEPVTDANRYTAEGQSSNVDLKVPWANVTWLNMTLTWTDDIGNNDQFELKVQLDGKDVDKKSGNTGQVTLNLEVPASGNYTAVITCVNAPGLVGPSPIDRDNGNNWALKATAVREVQI